MKYKANKYKALVAFAAVVLLGACSSGTINKAADTTTATETPATTEAPTTPPPTEAPTTTELVCPAGSHKVIAHCVDDPPTTTAAPVALAATDFTIDLVVTDSSCFDSAGANVTVEPSLNVVTAVPTDGREFQVIYEVDGGDHAETHSIDVDGDGKYTVDKLFMQTPTCDDVLTATVTQIRER